MPEEKQTTQAQAARRIAAILAMAEDAAKAGNEELRDTCLDKATALQLQYVIDDGMIAGQSRPTEETMGEEDFCTESNTPLIKAKRELVAALAGLYRGRAVMMGEWTVHKGTGAPKWDKRAKVRVYAYTSDLSFIRAMYTSLLLQMGTEMSRDEKKYFMISSAKGTVAGWRTSYAHSYVARAVGRLYAMKESQEKTVRDTAPGAVLVLRDRATAVDKYVDNLHTDLRKTRYKINTGNADGVAAGRAAADRADLGGCRVTRGGTRAVEA
jgi:hypothetical protein